MTKRTKTRANTNAAYREHCLRGRENVMESAIAEDSRRLQLLTMVQAPVEYQALGYTVWSQLMKALNSVGANVIEAAGYGLAPNTLRFFKMARGSAYESVFHAQCLGVDFVKDIEKLADDLDREIIALIDKLNDAQEAVPEENEVA